LDESESRFWDDEMEKAALAADRTVAFDGFYLRRRFDFKLYPAAMASTAVFDHVNLGIAYSA
jgi:hypothetical protein